jgi:hypothetical protein
LRRLRNRRYYKNNGTRVCTTLVTVQVRTANPKSHTPQAFSRCPALSLSLNSARQKPKAATLKITVKGPKDADGVRPEATFVLPEKDTVFVMLQGEVGRRRQCNEIAVRRCVSCVR